MPNILGGVTATTNDVSGSRGRSTLDATFITTY